MPRLLALIFAASALIALQGCSDRTPVSPNSSRLSAQNSSSFNRVGGLSSSSNASAPSGGSRLGGNPNGLQDASEDDYDPVSQAAIDAQIDDGSEVDSSSDRNDSGRDGGGCHSSEDQFGCAP